MLIFLDTEFTGLDQRSPSLIAIGLVTEDKQIFYAALPQATYINTARFANAVEKAFSTGKLRQHHALDDAKANRLGWLAAQD